MAKQQTAASIKAQIATLTAKLVEVEAAEALTQICVAVGDSLKFTFGRAANRKQYQGVVRAIAETDKGTRYKLVAGEGFDEEFFVIAASDIVVGDLKAVDAEIAKESGIGGADADPLSLLS
jgi:hypothetical protein